VILQESYDEQVDVWSLGCVLAELLGMQAPYDVKQCSPLLPGASCAGMSPPAASSSDSSSSSGGGERDQMAIILRLLGSPSEADLAWLGARQQHYLRTCFPQHQAPYRLEHIYPDARPELLGLLRRMLAFNPRRRITVDEALADPCFHELVDAERALGGESAQRQPVPQQPHYWPQPPAHDRPVPSACGRREESQGLLHELEGLSSMTAAQIETRLYALATSVGSDAAQRS
jgi:mitogen-activated protein kinase 1/3